MGKQLSWRSQESAIPLEERVRLLEARTEALFDAVRLLARGLEDGPMAETAGGPAQAARRAHELLLAMESVPPADPGAGHARTEG
jgi:hypothetical protein